MTQLLSVSRHNILELDRHQNGMISECVALAFLSASAGVKKRNKSEGEEAFTLVTVTLRETAP